MVEITEEDLVRFLIEQSANSKNSDQTLGDWCEARGLSRDTMTTLISALLMLAMVDDPSYTVFMAFRVGWEMNQQFGEAR